MQLGSFSGARGSARILRHSTVLGALLLGACGGQSAEPSSDAPASDGVGSVSSALIGSFVVGGQRLDVTDLGPIGQATAHIAACGDGVVYRSQPDGTLWSNADVTAPASMWKQANGGSPGIRIACDHSHFYALDATNHLWYARTAPGGMLYVPTGSISPWSKVVGGQTLGLPAAVEAMSPLDVDIQSGNGNLYAVARGAATTLYASALNDRRHPIRQGTPTSWIVLANNLGSKLATGAGSAGLVVPENRAFGMNPDGTLFMNDTLLAGQNWWSSFPNAGVTLTGISADSASVLYGMGHTGSDFTTRLYQYKFSEENCADGIDGDRNGLTDGDDPVCQKRMATNFCSLQSNGNYCIDRVKAGLQNALVKCQNGTPLITPGVCTHGAFGGLDFIAPPQNAEPANMGHYCNTINPDNTWGFAFTGAKPCDALLTVAGSKILRAGLYSTSAANDVLVRCNNGGVLVPGTGVTPLSSANAMVGHTNNACIFTVSPRQMPAFNAPFVTSAWSTAGVPAGQTQAGYAVGHMFDHDQSCDPADPNCPCPTGTCTMDLTQFGTGPGTATNLDTNGHSRTYDNQNSYDFILTEGTPLRALANGTVITQGSRGRDITGIGGFGTTRQNELLIRYDVGTDARYQESFLAYYAHLSQRLVQSDQVVKAGQIIGYVGMTGQATDPHVHFGLFRLTNVNATTPGNPSFGYKVDLHSDLTSAYGVNGSGVIGASDPYGWRAGGIDPWGHFFSRAKTGQGSTGMGTWSPTMWSSAGETPPY